MTLHKMRLLFLTFFVLLCTCSALGEGEVVLEDDLASEEEVTLIEEEFETPDLQLGDTGDGVSQLQRRLTELYYYSGNISGNFGESTQAAVKAFQEDFGLEATGVVDADTQALLYSTEYRPLQYGSSGDDVKELQTRLTELGYFTSKISGNYLESSQTAVREFQERNGLEGTGIADVDTQTLMYSGQAVGKNDRTSAATPTPTPDPGFLVDESATAEPLATVLEEVPFEGNLARGSTGARVKTLQNRLTELGYYTGPVSGNFLGNTLVAVKAFQEQNGLEVDGIVGEMTWNMLFNDLSVVLPEDTPRPTPTPTPVPFAVTVDVNNQVTTVYGRDENGDYTVVVRQMLCSTGTKSYPSDVGDWVLNGRTARWCYFPRWGGHAQYWTRINSSIAFHSVIYNSVNTMDLSVSSYKNLGTRVSHGCIRLTVADAKWIYDNVGEGTVVTIREDLPDDPELRASLELPPLDYSRMLPEETPEPTATPTYISGAMPPMPLEQMKKNSSGEDVWWLQAKLKELGYYGGTVTGTYLGGTVDAVKAFQKAVGLKADGIAGAATLEKLYEQELATPTPIPTPSPTPEVIATPVATPTPTATATPSPAPATDEATHALAVQEAETAAAEEESSETAGEE